MNMQRIPFRRFLASRWFAWSLVVVLLAILSGGGYYTGQLVEEREEYKRQVETMRHQYTLQVQESFELQRKLQKAEDTKKDVVRVVEETRPDGTTIKIKEETKEESSATTVEDSDSRGTKDATAEGVVETTKETEEEVKTRKVAQGSRFRLGAGVTVRDFSSAPDIEATGTARVVGPFHGRVSVEVDGATYQFEGASIGIEIEF